MKKRFIKFICLLSLTSLISQFTVPVFAASVLEPASGAEENDDYDDYENEEYYDDSDESDDYNDIPFNNSFYRPKSNFMSEFEYQEYCEEMYRKGYMDVNHDWIPSVQNFITNPSKDNQEKVNNERREVIEERIESGEILPEESPLLTYDEKQELIKKREAGQLPDPRKNPNYVSQEDMKNYLQEGNDKTDEEIYDEALESMKPSEDDESENDLTDSKQVLDKEYNEENQEESQEKGGLWNVLSKIILIAGAIIIVLIGYIIYKRQF